MAGIGLSPNCGCCQGGPVPGLPECGCGSDTLLGIQYGFGGDCQVWCNGSSGNYFVRCDCPGDPNPVITTGECCLNRTLPLVLYFSIVYEPPGVGFIFVNNMPMYWTGTGWWTGPRDPDGDNIEAFFHFECGSFNSYVTITFYNGSECTKSLEYTCDPFDLNSAGFCGLISYSLSISENE